jgi:hypothetical protein
MNYGNSIKTVKHVAKVGSAFWLIIFAIFAGAAYTHDKLNSLSDLIKILAYPSIIASILPFVVLITTFLNVIIEGETICLLVFYRFRYNPQSIDKITSIKVGRGLFSIYFEDGTAIRTFGMYIPELYRLVNDIKALRIKPLKVTSDWLSIE